MVLKRLGTGQLISMPDISAAPFTGIFNITSEVTLLYILLTFLFVSQTNVN